MEYSQGALYWDKRYREDTDIFEWLHEFSELETLLGKYIRENSTVQVVGCGTSLLSSKICERFRATVTSVDISSVAISTMLKYQASKDVGRGKDPKQCAYIHGDSKHLESLPLPCMNYDVVLDKALFDSQLCHENANQESSSLLTSIYNTLKPNGVYMSISCAHPGQRKTYLSDQVNAKPMFSWDIDAPILVPKKQSQTGVPAADAYNLTTKDDTDNYMYICHRKQLA